MNGSQVDFVQITAPFELLKDATFCIIPHLNQPGINKKAIREQLQNSRMVVFVIDPSNGISHQVSYNNNWE
jgi:hypothetical protein